MNDQERTPRELLEEEVRLRVRASQKLILEMSDGSERVFHITPMTFDKLNACLEDASGLISKVVDFGVKSEALGKSLIKIGDLAQKKKDAASSVGRDSSVTDESSPIEDVALSSSIGEALHEAFDASIFAGLGREFQELVQAFIKLGTDMTDKDMQDVSFVILMRIAISVVAYNIGPELKSFLSDFKKIKELIVNV